MAAQGAHLWLDKSSVNAAIAETFNSACARYFESLENENGVKIKSRVESIDHSVEPLSLNMPSPISFAKAVKNPAELEGMRNSHLRYLIWCRILVSFSFKL